MGSKRKVSGLPIGGWRKKEISIQKMLTLKHGRYKKEKKDKKEKRL
jgi:hypothetical protein